jgi:hypothetical protein
MLEATFTVTFCPDTEDVDEARQEALDFQACIRESGGYFHGLQFGLIEVVDIPDEDDRSWELTQDLSKTPY